MSPDDEESLLGIVKATARDVADIKRSVDPTIATRMAVAEERLDGVEERQQNSEKWLRRQLGAIITGALAVFAKWTAKG